MPPAQLYNHPNGDGVRDGRVYRFGHGDLASWLLPRLLSLSRHVDQVMLTSW